MIAQGAHAVAMEALLTERTSLASSHTMMDELASVADNVVHALRDQQGVLKNAHKKVLDLATTLGLSSTLIRIIERRTTADKFLVYGGMVAILAITLLVYWATR
jgi:Golgi SNAP receptor complex protein 2